jgi:hypothetical protein
MSSTSRYANVKHDNSNAQTSDVMTPNEEHPLILRCNNNEDSDKYNNNDDDDDVVMGKTENLTNHISYTSILASLCSSKQEKNQVTLTREQLTSNDVILGRGGYDKGLFAKVLHDWWPQYAAGTHSTKRTICRDAIRDMHQRGIRFINRIEDGTRHGYYTIEPKGSARVERKVLRSLREEVLNSTVRCRIIKEAEADPDLEPLPSFIEEAKADPIVESLPRFIITETEAVPIASPVAVPPTSIIDKPVKAKRARKGSPKQGPRKVRAVRSKVKSKRIKSSNLAKTKVKKQVKVASYSVPSKSKYIPILPSSLRPTQEEIKIVVPPPLRSSRSSSDDVPQVAMQTKTSFGSVTGTNTESTLPLIPSAINFGTSDLVPRNNDELVVSPQVIAASPDTVLTTDYLSFLNSSFGVVLKKPAKDLMGADSIPQPPLQSTASFDFKGIFDDAVVDNVMGDVDETLCPPVLAGRQSSMFSALSFKEWTQNQTDNDISATNQVNTNSEDRVVIPVVVPDVQSIQDQDDFVNSFKVKNSKSFDQATIFDEGTMPASPTAMYYNITNEVENFVNGTMPYITPQDKEHPERRNVKTPTRSNTKRSISDEYETADASTYHELCHKLEDSMAKLEDEEMQYKSWETHNEGLWRHFIQEQPDLAKMLLSHSGRNISSYESPGPTTTVHLPPRPTTHRTGGGSVSGSGCSVTFDSRNTSPVPWWFYHDNTANDNSCSGHQSVSMKWQQLFASECDENWEEV